MTQLGIFAKFWEAGRVKTRLAKDISEEAASNIYRRFVATLTRRFDDVAERRTLVYTPPDRAIAFAQLAGDRWQLVPQTLGDLGHRMRHFFTDAFRQGARRVVLLGSDSPTVPREYVQRAFDLLDRCSVVLGPTTDGGYYLIGASRQVPPIFDKLPWSTSAVWQETVNRLQAAQIPFAELPRFYDVDDLAGLERLDAELQKLRLQDDRWSELANQVRLHVSF